MTIQPIPADSTTRRWRTYALALTPAILIYSYRFCIVFLDWFSVCNISFLGLGVLGILLLRISLLNRAFVALCVLSIVAAIAAPRPFPEQIHLALFRSEYEAVVELARNHQLVHQDNCQFDAYALPRPYSNLDRGKSKCIYVKYEPALTVVFEPLFDRELLVYAETPEAAKSYISCGGSDGAGYCHLGGNWYECFVDWN